MSCFIKSKVPRLAQWKHDGLEYVRFVPIGAAGTVKFVTMVAGRSGLSIDWEASMIIVTSKDASGNLTNVDDTESSTALVGIHEEGVELDEVELDSAEFSKFQQERRRGDSDLRSERSLDIRD